MIMCIQNLVSICSFFLKILSKNQILTSIKNGNSVANLRKTMIYDTNIHLVNDNVYTKFGLNRSIRFQDIEQKLNSDDDPRGVANLDPRSIIGRIYVEYYLTLLHTKYTSFRPCGFREEDFKCFPMLSLRQIMTPPGPIWTPGSRLAGIMKGPTKHRFT